MSIRSFSLLLSAAVVVAACERYADPTAPPMALQAHRSSLESNGTAITTRPHFIFLEPLTQISREGPFAGTFDPTLQPIVSICKVSGTTCGQVLAELPATLGDADATPEEEGEFYRVTWQARHPEFVAGSAYRLQVSVAGTILGRAELMAVKKGEATAVDATRFVAVEVNQPLKVRFRIEAGAVFVVDGAVGGTVSAEDGAVSISVPAGATDGALGITVDEAQVDLTQPANANVAGGSTVELGPDGTQFSVPVTITLQYDPARAPAGFSEAALRLGTLVNGRWVEVRGSSVDPATNTVTGTTTHFSTYGVVAFETFSQIAIGDAHACGINSAQDVYCWGLNNFGQLGSTSIGTCADDTGSHACTLAPTLVRGGIKFASIAAAEMRTCGISVDGDAYCWGTGSFGRLGNGGTSDTDAPALVSGGHKWSMISVGVFSTCALTTAGQGYCWGRGIGGALGTPTAPDVCAIPTGTQPCALTPVPIASSLTFTEISAGLQNGCALAVGGAGWCWGLGAFGVVGDGTTITRFSPVPVSGGLTFRTISAGGLTSCGVTVTDVGYCWGNNNITRLGIGVGPNQLSPAPVSGGLSFDRIVANAANLIFEHNCSLTTAGEAWCWGGNDAQQLGFLGGNEVCTSSGRDGIISWNCNNVPVIVPGGHTFRQVAVGGELTCLAGRDGQTYCMGDNTFGQVGDGTTGSSRSFSVVPRP